jgi:peptidoglycan hydrolase-like protein with peptidoglycan-binding domain
MENYNGIAPDTRSEEEKAKDYKTSDLAQGDIVLNWKEYNETDFLPLIIQNQDGSSSCVAQGTSKILAMHEIKEGREYTRLCPKFIYLRRQNYPDGGMWLPDALSIACKYGSCPEIDMPCDNQGESFMNEKNESAICPIDALKFKGKAYFQITGGIDEIAKIIEQGYGVLMGARFDYDEWTDVPFVKEGSTLKCGHGIAGTRYCLYKGEKAIMIEDSWGPHYGKGGVRILTESFIKARVFYVGYITSLEDVKFIFTKILRIGMPKCLDVKMLQTRLKITVDGIFGRKTKLAVMAWQLSNGLIPDGIIGPKSIKVLNK